VNVLDEILREYMDYMMTIN